MDSSEAEAIPEENFYSSVLEQAHSKTEDDTGPTVDAVLQSFENADAVPVPPMMEAPTGKANLDSMTRAELVSLAESKGIRVKRSMNRGEVLNLLRRMDSTQNESIPTGAENVSGSAGSSEQIGSSLDGSLPVDMEQVGGLDQ
jgi:hypothetical protein